MYELVIGNKNWSSWSLRPWFVLVAFDIPFKEHLIGLRQPGSKAKIVAQSPSGLVPALREGDQTIWDSLAIAETLADRFPDKHLWPDDSAARAYGRSISAEMHSGFGAMRQEMPMDFVSHVTDFQPSPAARPDIDRIVAIWTEARGTYSQDGDFLLGPLSIADAMFAPVVSRFRTYGINLQGPAASYMEQMWKLAAMQRWYKEAKAEMENPPLG